MHIASARRLAAFLHAVLIAALIGAGARADDAFRAGFAEVDITPPIGVPKQGANAKQLAETVLDPLFARAAVLEAGGEIVALVQLDLAMVTAEDTAAIRERVQRDHGLSPGRVLVAATHNHAGPAVIDEALPRDAAWARTMIENAAVAVGRALAVRTRAEAGAASAFEWEVAFNRRVLMRDGTARTHGSFKDPDALAFEGPIDPEVAVFAVRAPGGQLLGALVSFACHPAHHGGDGAISAGFPGVIARRLREKGVPVTLYLQGAAGDLHHNDPRGYPEKSLEEIGVRLADDAQAAIGRIAWQTPSRVAALSTTLSVPYREATEEDILGTRKGTQRFGEKGYYDRKIPELVARIRERRAEAAEVQAFRIGDIAFATQPSESFAAFGLRIKRETWPVRTFVVGYANGMLGYIPTRESFEHGGYEATFGPPSCMAPDAGDRLADAAVELVRRLWR